jgi:peptidoglycan hydrolase CwlO-like protein
MKANNLVKLVIFMLICCLFSSLFGESNIRTKAQTARAQLNDLINRVERLEYTVEKLNNKVKFMERTNEVQVEQVEQIKSENNSNNCKKKVSVPMYGSPVDYYLHPDQVDRDIYEYWHGGSDTIVY